MSERGLRIDDSTLNRWVVHFALKLEKAFHRKKKQPGICWRIKRVTRPMLGFNNFHSARATLVEIELFTTKPPIVSHAIHLVSYRSSDEKQG